MPQQQHSKTETLLFSNGAWYSVEQEYIGLIGKQGTYVDSRNGRLTPEDNNNSAWNRIKGEEILYPLIYNQCIGGTGLPVEATYKCMNACVVNGYLFEVWCDKNKVLPTFFRIQGKIVALSALIKFNVDYPIEWDVNNTVIGGEVFLTDFQSGNPPQIFSVKDLMENSGVSFVTGKDDPAYTCTEVYFTEYNPGLYSINQTLPADHPAIINVFASNPDSAIYTTIGTGGLLYGSYQYRFRFKNAFGDPTLMSKPTPLVPVPAALGTDDTNYPYEKTYGGIAAGQSAMGIAFKFRINNWNNYEQCEIIRVSFNIGSPLNSAGSMESIYTFNISPGTGTGSNGNVVGFFDFGATGTAIDSETATNTMSVVDHARAVRYYDKRQYLMNLVYQGRDLDNAVSFLDAPDKLFPIVKKLYKSGHKDPYHVAYNKPYLHGEKYGFAVVFYDSFGARSFAVPINDASALYPALGNFNNFQMPNRRDKPDTSADVYGLGLVQAEQVDNSSHGDSFEVFDLADGTSKSDDCRLKNIADLSITAGVSTNYKTFAEIDNGSCDTIPTGSFNSDGAQKFTGGGGVNRVAADYEPFHPTAEIDTDVSGNDFRINTLVNTDGTNGGSVDYSPVGFSPDYYALGMALAGVDSVPDWVASFSVVRTKPAGRVVCQGIGMYSLKETDPHDHGSNAFPNPIVSGAGKGKDSFWFYSPDLAMAFADPTVLNSNPSRYKIQFVSPLGFFSEVYDYRTSSLPTLNNFQHRWDYNVDMISYARILFEDGSINIGDTTGTVGQDGYVQFGNWRNVDGGGSVPADFGGGGNTLFDFASIASVNNYNASQGYWEITLNGMDLYNENYASSDTEFDENGVKKWHEPWYIVNIIDTAVDVDTTTNQREYVETEHYQKMLSVVGVSNGATSQSFDLIDERWEDCITTVANETKFVYVKDGTIEYKWCNITNKTGGEIIDILADALSGTNTSGINADGKLKGVYTHTITTATNGSATPEDRFYTLVFNSTGQPNPQLWSPTNLSQIIVRYDNAYPCVVFGGDVTVGESIFAPIDGITADGGYVDTDEPLGQFRLRMAFPYRGFTCNPRYYIFDGIPGTGNIQDTRNGSLEYIRQMMVMFSCESRLCVPYAFNTPSSSPYNVVRFFPSVGYVMRPHRWFPASDYNDPSAGGNNVFTAYGSDYPEELVDYPTDLKPARWIYGGFRFLQIGTVTTNIDYSHDQDNFKDYSKPTVGFEEVDWFPTRVIWSEKREINVQNSPGLKTFPALNFIDIADDTGAIMQAFDAYGNDKGSNLYAITEGGICLLMVEKFEMRQATSDTMGLMKGEGDTAILEQIWLSKEQGLPEGFFRSFAEMGNDCWFANQQSVWKLTQNQLVDIGRKNYHSRVWRDMIRNVAPGFSDDMTAIYDNYHNEYWLSHKKGMFQINDAGNSVILDSNTYYDGMIFQVLAALDVTLPADVTLFGSCYIYNNTGADLTIYDQTSGAVLVILLDTWIALFTRDPLDDTKWIYAGNEFAHVFTRLDLEPILFAYQDDGGDKGKWLGYYDYDFDFFAIKNNSVFGMRSLDGTYTLDTGDTINGENIEGGLLIASTGGGVNQIKAKEFIRIRVASTQKPTRIEFYDSLENFRNGVISSFLDVSQGTLYLKDYDGYENFIPRKFALPYERQQGRLMLAYVRFNGTGTFFTPSIEVNFKTLK